MTVVLYTTMVTFAELPEVHGEQYVLAVLAFFTVSLGGLSLGVVFGLVTALLTRTTEEVRGERGLGLAGLERQRSPENASFSCSSGGAAGGAGHRLPVLHHGGAVPLLRHNKVVGVVGEEGWRWRRGLRRCLRVRRGALGLA